MTRRLSTAVAVILLPAIAVVTGVIGATALTADAPERVATHWNAAGEADGFASPGTVVAQIGVLGLALTVLFAVFVLLGRREPQAPSFGEKLLTAGAAGSTALVSGLGIWILAVQQHAGDRPEVWPGLAIALGVATVVGAVAWLITPAAVPRQLVDPRPAGPVPLAPTERAAWMRTARLPWWAVAVMGLGILALIGGVGVAVATTDGNAWPVLVVPTVVGAFLLGLSSYTVTVDGSGLQVRGLLGLPAWRIAPDLIASAGTVEVAPLADFGGWGVRLGRGGRTGVITRAGEALHVRRRDGRALVVTVDDAGTAAALLGAVAERAATTGGR